MSSNYSTVLSNTLPFQPPAYDIQDLYSRDLSQHTNLGQPIEQFEIDEDQVYEYENPGSTLQRLDLSSRHIFHLLKDRVVAPLSRLIGPLAEASDFLATQYERTILKIGNPLVVKRLLYVLIVVLVMYVIRLGSNNEVLNRSGGGAFSSGKLYNVEILGNTLKSFMSTKTLKENTEYLSSMPHFAGTTGDLALARYVESYFSNNGIDTIEFYELESFLNYPKREGTYIRHADGSFDAILYEETGDEMQNWAFSPNSPSTDGEMHAPYVYAGQGCLSDYEKLYSAEIDIKGAILLIKYGGDIPEANKVAAAYEHGAIAVVFITPPVKWAGSDHDDAIQKVNVGLTRHSPGDVLTPSLSLHGIQSTRLSWDKSPVTAKIPCIPISYRDAKQLLAKVESRGVKFGDGLWSGDRSELDMIKLRISQEERPSHSIWNVVGSIKGREQANKGIIFGAPRDSVAYGASSSASSTAVLLELVKAFTSLQRRFNWTPSRSIYFISFDASEYNLAGSAEWVKLKKEQLKKEGLTYIEVSDIYSGDILSVEANPLLQDVLRGEMRNVELSRSSKVSEATVSSLYDIYKEQHGGSEEIPNNFIQNKDFIPFINLVNIPSLDIGFRSNKAAAPKDSCLDSFSNLEKQIESSMMYHLAISELLARVGLRLVEDPLIPYNFNDLEKYLRRSSKDLENFAHAFIAKSDSEVNPHMSYDSLYRAIDCLATGVKIIEGFRKDWGKFIESSSSIEPVMLAAKRKAANDNMILFNEVFLAEGGITDRAGYINCLFGVPYDAPSFQNETYDWTSFPLARDYIMKGKFGKAQNEIVRISTLLESASEALDPQ